jgi:predicted RNase H-like HicB family nuclease
VHAQVLDFPAAITCASDFDAARRLLAIALADVAETAIEFGLPLPIPDPSMTNPEMDVEEPIDLY